MFNVINMWSSTTQPELWFPSLAVCPCGTQITVSQLQILQISTQCVYEAHVFTESKTKELLKDVRDEVVDLQEAGIGHQLEAWRDGDSCWWVRWGDCGRWSTHWKVGCSIPDLHAKYPWEYANLNLLSDAAIGVWILHRKHLSMETCSCEWGCMYKVLRQTRKALYKHRSIRCV